MRELLSNISLFVGQLYEDKSLALHTRDLISFTTDTAGADIFLKYLSNTDVPARLAHFTHSESIF